MSAHTHTSRCPRCNTTDAYPAIATDEGEAAFVLICAYCGARRPFPAPAPTAEEENI